MQVTEARAAYALARARIEVRLAELREALDRHEAGQRWDRTEVLDRIERGLARLVEEVQWTSGRS